MVINMSCCNSFRRCSNTFPVSKEKVSKPTLRRTVIVSKKVPQALIEEEKCVSTGNISSNRPRRTTLSDRTFQKNHDKLKNKVDLQVNCGDGLTTSKSKIKSTNSKTIRSENISKSTSSAKTNVKGTKSHIKASENDSKTGIFLKVPVRNSSVQQYFKNEKFFLSQDSVPNVDSRNSIKKDPSLEAIKEDSRTDSESGSNDLKTEHYDFIDTNNFETIRKINEFRKQNYFECHSSKSRLASKCSTTSLENHKCIYRFYLNERLFPVPLSTDHQDTIRCVECHLPLNEVNNDNDEINGTIQVKVKLDDNETQDMTLLLPVKNNLIIKPKKKTITPDDTFYFGIIKLNAYGHSKFNPAVPEDSLALKYQKGYKQYIDSKPYVYKQVNSNDVIRI